MPSTDQPVAIEMRIPPPPDIESWKQSATRLPNQENMAELWKHLALALFTAMDYNQYRALSIFDLESSLLSPHWRASLETSVKSGTDALKIFDPKEFASEIAQLRVLRFQVQNELDMVRKELSELRTGIGLNSYELTKGDRVYLQFKDELERSASGKIVAIDIESQSVAGIGNSIIEAYEAAQKKTGVQKFVFKRVGTPYLFSI